MNEMAPRPARERLVRGDLTGGDVRFIPHRSAIDLHTAFQLHRPPPWTTTPPSPVCAPVRRRIDSAANASSSNLRVFSSSAIASLCKKPNKKETDPSFEAVLETELFNRRSPLSAPGRSRSAALASPASRLSPRSATSVAPALSASSSVNIAPSTSASSLTLLHYSPSTDSWGTGLPGASPTNTRATLDLLHPEYNLSPLQSSTLELLNHPDPRPRSIPGHPMRVLDAPKLVDDFYSDMLDWSSTDLIGVGLGRGLWIWNAQSHEVTKVFQLDEAGAYARGAGADPCQERLSSVKFERHGSHIATGSNLGIVQIWDASTQKLIRTLRGHTAQVGALAWNGPVLSTGSRDRYILHRDLRAPSLYIKKIKQTKSAICGLKWSAEGAQLAAGSKENKCLIFDGLAEVRHSEHKTYDSLCSLGIETPTHRLRAHTAAVKALAWSPHQRGLLVTGAGIGDTHLRAWNSTTGHLVGSAFTGVQICNLVWAKTMNELVTAHGFSEEENANCVRFWKYPQLSSFASIKGSSHRLLFLTISPDGTTIVTGSGDETLRFYEVFPRSSTRKSSSTSPLNPLLNIR